MYAAKVGKRLKRGEGMCSWQGVDLVHRIRGRIASLFFVATSWVQKVGRRLTRTIGLWGLGVLGYGSRTIKICSFGNQVPSECCSDKYFRSWMCGFATGVGGWEGGLLL